MKAKLNKTAQGIAAAGEAKDSSRPVLTNVCIRGGRAIAGNGFILATAPVEVEGDEGHDMLIPIAMIAALQESSPLAKKVGIEVEEVGEDVKGIVVNGKELIEASAPRKEFAFPDYEAMVPKTAPKAFISFSGTLLKQLVKVVGDDDLIFFRIREPDKPVEFVSGDVHGFIQPAATSDRGIDWWGEK